jgi:hypothetical protein
MKEFLQKVKSIEVDFKSTNNDKLIAIILILFGLFTIGVEYQFSFIIFLVIFFIKYKIKVIPNELMLFKNQVNAYFKKYYIQLIEL